MVSQTFNAIYIGTIGDPNIFDIDMNRPAFQSNQPNDPDRAENGGIDAGDTTAKGAGLFLNHAYSGADLRKITLSRISPTDCNIANTNAGSLTDGGQTAIFESTACYGGTLIFDNGSGGTITVNDVRLRIIQDADGRTYFIDTHGGSGGRTDFDNTLETYGLNNLVSITPKVRVFGGNYRTTPNSNGSRYVSHGSITIEGSATLDSLPIQSIAPGFTPGTIIATARGPVAVEHLKGNDLILDRVGNALPIFWHGRSTIRAEDQNRVVVLPAGVLGLDRETIVSEQHCMVIEVDGKDHFVKAKLLAEWGWQDCHFAEAGDVTCHHVLLTRHAVISANGAQSEAFYPGAHIMQTLSENVRATLLSVLPALRKCEEPDDVIRCYGKRALPILTRAQFTSHFGKALKVAA